MWNSANVLAFASAGGVRRAAIAGPATIGQPSGITGRILAACGRLLPRENKRPRSTRMCRVSRRSLWQRLPLGNETLEGRAEGGLERETGFEPATSCLEGRCSTN